METTRDKGWVAVERSVMDEWIWNDNKAFDVFHAWVDILFSVNYKAKQMALKNKIITIEPGCVLTSKLKLSKRWGWSTKRVSNFLELLRQSKKIEFEKMANGIMIRIIQKRNSLKSSAASDENAFFSPFEEQLGSKLSSEPTSELTSEPTSELCHTTKEGKEGKEGKECLIREEGKKPAACLEKQKYSDNILLTKEEYDSLVLEFGDDVNAAITFVSAYKLRTGKHYDSDYHAIRSWGISAVRERKASDGNYGNLKYRQDDGCSLLATEETAEEFEMMMWNKMNAEN